MSKKSPEIASSTPSENFGGSPAGNRAGSSGGGLKEGFPPSDQTTGINKKLLLKLFLKTTLFTFLFLFLFALFTAAGVAYWAYQKAEVFSQNAQVSLPKLVDIAKTGWKTVPNQTDGRVNFLVLGTDGLATRGHESVLTDTMLIASVNLHSGTISLFSIPRDLWLPDYKTKINALYTYGKDRYPDEPQRFPREVVEQLTGITIHHTVMIDLDTLAALIDEIGGVDVNVKVGFVDTQFPNPNVDVTKEKDPKKLYETVEFKPGVEHMSGARVLEFVRSRHAAGDQGTDDARAQRQQDVIFSLVNTLKQPSFFKDLPRLGRTYHFYDQHFAQYLPITEAIGMGRALLPYRNALHFVTGGPSIYPDDPQGIITHPVNAPQSKYQGQWVYEIRDPANFQKEVKQKLGM